MTHITLRYLCSSQKTISHTHLWLQQCYLVLCSGLCATKSRCLWEEMWCLSEAFLYQILPKRCSKSVWNHEWFCESFDDLWAKGSFQSLKVWLSCHLVLSKWQQPNKVRTFQDQLETRPLTSTHYCVKDNSKPLARGVEVSKVLGFENHLD